MEAYQDVLCSAAVCSQIQRQIGLSWVCLGWTQQGVEEGRLNKCVCVWTGAFMRLCIAGCHREGWGGKCVCVCLCVSQAEHVC